MSKNPQAGSDYTVLESGVIKVARHYANPSLNTGDDGKSPNYLDLVDHELAIGKKKDYEKQLADEERTFNELVRKLKENQLSLLTVLQGRDTSGKSGAARRIWEATHYDPKLVRWIPFGEPTDEELAHTYMWRFFRHDYMPGIGQVRIFDRSWAERMLVEPVEKIIDQKTLIKSYSEIRTFELNLRGQGLILVKFWMDITKDEQRRRLDDRAKNRPDKLSPSDEKARAKWDEYTEAANAMLHFTGTQYAPWYVISAEDKRYSRVNVLRTINDVMRQTLAEKKS